MSVGNSIIKVANKASMELRYGDYFDMNYLLKYGYFDFKYSANDYHEDYILSNLLYKKVFNMDILAKAFNEIRKEVKFTAKKETVPMEISIYKNENERRNLKFPNLYSYICLCIHICNYRDKYMEILYSSEKSLSNEFYNTSFLKGRIKREENRIGYKHIFKTDVQNFYPTIYTHSIPWILVGKEMAKEKRGKNWDKEYFNELDSLIQKCQRSETHGLPTGSFASRLIAEIYMCKLDEKLKEYPYVRYVDDYELAYNDESERVEFYKTLTKELRHVNLKLKAEKNKIDTFPFEGNNNSAFFFDYFSHSYEIKDQTKRIYNFLDSSIYKEREGYKGALKLMFKALKSSIVKEEILQEALTRPLLKKLFNMVLMRPHLSVYYLEFIDVIKKDNVAFHIKMGIEEIRPKILMNIERYIDLSYHQELFSILSIFHYLNLNSICDKQILLKIIKEMDDLSAVLAFDLLLPLENGLDKSTFETIEEKLANSECWEEEFWFFKYHVIAKINKDKKSKVYKKYKEYIYEKYSDGIDKGKFFNKDNIKKVQSPINLKWQQEKSEPNIGGFFTNLINKGIYFVR